jgi:hypothetical protein
MNNPASPYLLDRLQARRANANTRSRRSTSVGLGDDLFLDEARSSGNDILTTTPNNTHTPANTNASLGVREIEKRMDKLSKLNFDLKLELFHCRERMAKLQENCNSLASRADDANRLVDENATLLELNDSLLKELERRDDAVQEAVSIICDLEERLEHAQQLRKASRDHSEPPTDLRASSVSPCPRAVLSPSKSDKSSRTRSSSAKRIPSFVDDKKSNTRALRSVYLEPKSTLRAAKSFVSLASQIEDVDKSLSDVDTLDSPRLSVLSKSSFPSIYNLQRSEESVKHQENTLNLPSSQLDHISRNAGSKHDSNSDVNSWIQVQTPQSSVQFSGKHMPQSRSDLARVQRPAYYTAPSQVNQKRTPSLKSATFGATSLPPTPDSASTSLLQDSYMTGQPIVQHKSTKHLTNAAKHAALLHTPETPSITDMSNLHATQDAKNPMIGVGWFNRHSMSLSSTDEEDEYYGQSDSDRTGSAGTDASYPDGGSIPKGTPSRFQLRRNISPARDVPHDGEGTAQSLRQGQETKEKWALLPKSNEKTRFQMERSETTPNLAALQTPPASLQRTSSTSGSSSLRPHRMERSETTPNLATNMQAAMSTPFPQPGPTMKPNISGGGGVRAALSQKTQKLFRRMSEHHTSTSEQPSKQRGITLSPSKRSTCSNSRSGSDESLAMQAANQTLTSQSFGAPQNSNSEARSPSRGLFSRAAGSLRR